MATRKNLDARATALMLMLCSIWSLQQIIMKATSPDMTPLLQVTLRSGMAAFMVGVYLRSKGMGLLPANGAWLAGCIAGLLFTLEYYFAAEGLRYTNASHMIIMLYTAPAFAALGLHFLVPEERLHPVQWLGLIIAFCGIAVAFYEGNTTTANESSKSMLFGDFMGLLAGVAWGATTVLIRRSRLSETPATQTVFMQLAVAFIMLLPACFILGKAGFTLSPRVVISLSYQTLIVSFASFLVWYWLLRVYSASQLGALSFCTPILGVIFGIILLNEKAEANFIAGTAMVLSGIALVSGWQWLKPRFTKRLKQ